MLGFDRKKVRLVEVVANFGCFNGLKLSSIIKGFFVKCVITALPNVIKKSLDPLQDGTNPSMTVWYMGSFWC
jgi:hypothetical protein